MTIAAALAVVFASALAVAGFVGLSLVGTATARETAPSAVFNETYGGSSHQSANTIIQTNDGGYAVAVGALVLVVILSVRRFRLSTTEWTATGRPLLSP